MLPKENRLKSKKDFNSIFDAGKTASKKDGRIILRFFQNGSNKAKIGVVVGKSCFLRATERNKAKRLVREAARESIGLISPGWKISVQLRTNSQKGMPSLKDLKKELRELLMKSNLIKIR